MPTKALSLMHIGSLQIYFYLLHNLNPVTHPICCHTTSGAKIFFNGKQNVESTGECITVTYRWAIHLPTGTRFGVDTISVSSETFFCSDIII